VPRLTLVIPDLYPARQSLDAQAALPRLPSLERWLARGRAQGHASHVAREMDKDWRHWLLARHAPAWQGAGLAAVAARAHAPPGTGPQDAGLREPGSQQAWWLATPVHFVAGLDTLRLHPSGLLPLSRPEQEALAVDFARVFAGSGWALVPSGRRELLLLGPAAGAQTCDPARWLGADPTGGLPTGPAAAPLKRLGAELEMWLHEHPVNQARAARGQLVATAIWLWGAGVGASDGYAAGERVRTVRARPATDARSLVLHGADAFLDGLAAVTGAARPGEAATLAVANQAAPGGDDVVAVLGSGEPLSSTLLQQWEVDWFAPALRQWQAGQWQALTLACGAEAWLAGRGPLAALRGWRSAGPWWERLLAC
jgi:hypothetical protein